jgi:ankyrin repeat protein
MNPTFLKTIRVAIRDGDDETAIGLINSNPQLLDSIIPPFGSWLHMAASSGRIKVVQNLLDKNVDIDLKSGVFNGSALNEAATQGHTEIVGCLLGAGAAMDVTSSERNPLFGAILARSLKTAKILIDAGIDWHVKYTSKTMKDMDAYAFAIERGQTEIASYLRSLDVK